MTHHADPPCRYHHAHPAYWHCRDCSLNLCTDCKPFADQLPIPVDCPLCGQAMAEIESLAAIPRRQALGLLSDPALLATLAAVTLAVTLVPWPIPGLLLAVPAGLVLMAALVMRARAAGEAWRDPRVLRRLREIDHLEFTMQTAGFSLPFIAAWLLGLGMQSMLVMLLAALVASVLMPAVLMATLITGSAREGLRPRRFMPVVETLGNRYIPLAVSTGAAIALVWGAALALGGVLSVQILAPALAATGCLLALGWSHLIGSVLYRNRRMLDYPAGVPAIDRPRPPAPAQYEPAQLVADADIIIREGRHHQARQQLGRALTRFPDEPALNQRFERLLRDSGDTKEHKRYLERRMQRLMRAGQARAATELWQRNSPALDNWLPRVPATRYQLAIELDEIGDHQTAFRLLVSLPLKARGIGTPGAAWLRAAIILEDRLGDPARAKQLRGAVEERLAGQAGGSARPQRRRASSPETTAIGGEDATEAARTRHTLKRRAASA